MEVSLDPGKYIMAVSGGVDSVVLLNVLSKQTGLELVIAHFDHGIRPDSVQDLEFVRSLAHELGLSFVSESVVLGPTASEATARTARYKFLREVMKQESAKAIVTAHHEDDLIETILINVMRGTGRKGLSPLHHSPDVERPLLNISKQEILKYAQINNLTWREDSTNQDPKYLRNYLRLSVLPKLKPDDRKKMLALARSTAENNKEMDETLSIMLQAQGQHEISRTWFASLPYNVSSEVLSHWLRQHDIGFDNKTIKRLVASLKTLPSGSRAQINNGRYFLISKNSIRLQGPQSV